MCIVDILENKNEQQKKIIITVILTPGAGGVFFLCLYSLCMGNEEGSGS